MILENFFFTYPDVRSTICKFPHVVSFRFVWFFFHGGLSWHPLRLSNVFWGLLGFWGVFLSGKSQLPGSWASQPTQTSPTTFSFDTSPGTRWKRLRRRGRLLFSGDRHVFTVIELLLLLLHSATQFIAEIQVALLTIWNWIWLLSTKFKIKVEKSKTWGRGCSFNPFGTGFGFTY